MNKIKLPYIVFSIVVVCVICSCDLGMQQEGAKLQAVEHQFKEIEIVAPLIHMNDDQAFLIVRGSVGNVVIMLNPRHAPYYKQLPYRISYELSEEEFSTIRRTGHASRTVLNVLESRISIRSKTKQDNTSN